MYKCPSDCEKALTNLSYPENVDFYNAFSVCMSFQEQYIPKGPHSIIVKVIPLS